MQRFANRDCISIVQSGSQHYLCLRDCFQSEGMGYIAAQQNVLGMRLCANSISQFLFKASRTDEDQSGLGKFCPYEPERFDLQRYIILGLKSSHKNEHGVVRSEKRGQRLGQ